MIMLMVCYKAINMRLNRKNIAMIINIVTENPFASLDTNEKIIREKFDKMIE